MSDKHRVEIIPAILAQSLEDIRERLSRVEGAAAVVQLDIVDGVLAKHKSWPYTPGGKEEFAHMLTGEAGLPFWEEFDFEIDLMVAHSSKDAREWIGAGASRLVVHAASVDSRATLLELQQFRADRNYPVSLGLALACSDTFETLKAYDDLYDYIQVMGISTIGMQGATFDARALELVSAIHAAMPDVPIQIDGGVHAETAARIVDAGARRLVIGSAIFNEGDARENIASFTARVS